MMTDFNGEMRFFLSQKKLTEYDLHEQGAIKATNQNESGDCELGYPEDWLGDDHVWIDAAKELENLSFRFGDICSVEGYSEAATYLGDMRYIMSSIEKFMEAKTKGNP
jgi:hypothetical protein